MLISKNWITRLLNNAGNEGWSVSDEELELEAIAEEGDADE